MSFLSWFMDGPAAFIGVVSTIVMLSLVVAWFISFVDNWFCWRDKVSSQLDSIESDVSSLKKSQQSSSKRR